MYLYFLPLAQPSVPDALYIPTPDGGIEHTAARFLYPLEWLSLLQAGSIRLLEPQFFLLSLIAQHLSQPPSSHSIGSVAPSHTHETLAAQRISLLDFVKTGDPPWGEKCISPWTAKKRHNRLVMRLDLPGPELEMTNKRGDDERVICLEFGDKGEISARKVEWRTPREPPVLKDEEEQKEHTNSRSPSREVNKDDQIALRGKEKL